MSSSLLEAVALWTSLQASVRSTVPGQVYSDCTVMVEIVKAQCGHTCSVECGMGAGCCMHRFVQVCGPSVVWWPRLYRVGWCLL